MGKWNHRRWTSRRKYYDQPDPPDPPTYFETEFKLRGSWKNIELPWEERFCISVGIPWEKVVIAKRYMHCHDNVVSWNDSAGEETFNNAKRRFWAEINGLPCDVPMPDQNMYIDEIDWNHEIDPELILDLDRSYFNPDEQNARFNTKNGSTGDNCWDCSRPDNNGARTNNDPWECNLPNNKSAGPSTNSWEGSLLKNNGALDDVSCGMDRWGNSTVDVQNQWERGRSPKGKAILDSTWGGSMNKLWDQRQGFDSKGLYTDCGNSWDRKQGLDSKYRNSWGYVEHTKEKGWGTTGNRSSGWNNSERNFREKRNPEFANGRSETWGAGYKNSTGCRDYRNNQWECQGDAPNGFNRGRSNQNDWGRNGGSRKREGSQHYNPCRYKSSRYEADDYGTVNRWKKESSQKRVSFAFD